MHTGLALVGAMCAVLWVFQFLPIILVPITGRGVHYDLSFASYRNISFGVFGVCDTASHACSKPHVGYPVARLSYADDDGVESVQFGAFESGGHAYKIELPSDAVYSISKLLVTHAIAFFFSSLLLVLSAWVLLITHVDEHYTGAPMAEGIKMIFKRAAQQRQGRKRDITGYLDWMFALAMLLFLLTLLAFLVDILLFVPKLGYMGWMQLLPITFMVLSACLMCVMKRSIASRRHLEEIYPVGNDMRLKHVVEEWNDDASDDGFYVFTNGFRSDNAHSDHVSVISSNLQVVGDEVELRELRQNCT